MACKWHVSLMLALAREVQTYVQPPSHHQHLLTWPACSALMVAACACESIKLLKVSAACCSRANTVGKGQEAAHPPVSSPALPHLSLRIPQLEFQLGNALLHDGLSAVRR